MKQVLSFKLKTKHLYLQCKRQIVNHDESLFLRKFFSWHEMPNRNACFGNPSNSGVLLRSLTFAFLNFFCILQQVKIVNATMGRMLEKIAILLSVANIKQNMVGILCVLIFRYRYECMEKNSTNYYYLIYFKLEFIMNDFD